MGAGKTECGVVPVTVDVGLSGGEGHPEAAAQFERRGGRRRDRRGDRGSRGRRRGRGPWSDW